MRVYRRLILAALLLTLGVVILGAYVRLSDAGLGCPDWPGCYGKLTPFHAAEEIEQAQAIQPEGPVSHAKAWKEMIHRYFAGGLGLLIVAVFAWAWKNRKDTVGSPVLPTLLLGLIVFQVLLGMWTVTERLKPLVVTGHLLGGMTTLALLTWLWQREAGASLRGMTNVRHLRLWGGLALVAVSIQIALGGWVSANYAALACTDFPKCQGAWIPEMDFEAAFTLYRDLGMDASGNLLTHQALTAIHWVHRVWAAVVLLFVGYVVFRLLRQPELSDLGGLLGLLLLIQVSLGVANVWLGLPLLVAVLHNAGAAMLLMVLVVVNFRLFRMR